MAGLVITPEIEADALRLAERTGVTPAEAVASALRKVLAAQPLPRGKRLDEARAVLERIHSYPVDYSLSEDEILGYDEFGVPEQPYLDR